MELTINKENSRSFVRITQFGDKFDAAYMQATDCKTPGEENIIFGAKSFKTLNGAKKWSAAKLA